MNVGAGGSSMASAEFVDVSGGVPIVVPELGIRDTELVVSLWLVSLGERVAAGDRVVELLAGSTTIDLEAPVAGRLVRQRVEEDDPVRAGDVIGDIDPVQTA